MAHSPVTGRRQTETDTAVSAGEHTNRWENEEEEERDSGAKKERPVSCTSTESLVHMAGNENGPHVEPTSKTKKKKGEGGEKQKPYVFRHGMINKMFFFFIDIKNEST